MCRDAHADCKTKLAVDYISTFFNEKGPLKNNDGCEGCETQGALHPPTSIDRVAPAINGVGGQVISSITSGVHLEDCTFDVHEHGQDR